MQMLPIPKNSFQVYKSLSCIAWEKKADKCDQKHPKTATEALCSAMMIF